MATQVTSPVKKDAVSKVEDEVSVGEDLRFQRKWWKFENTIWVIFAIILLLDAAGAFGRGPLAKARKQAADGTFDVKYERIERTGTPSFMSIQFRQSAIHNGQIKLFVSESVVKELGAERVIPAPLSTEVGNGGLLYTFPALGEPAEVHLSLQPTAPGKFDFLMQVPGGSTVGASVVVVP